MKGEKMICPFKAILNTHHLRDQPQKGAGLFKKARAKAIRKQTIPAAYLKKRF
jgi:hypothetical protein